MGSKERKNTPRRAATLFFMILLAGHAGLAARLEAAGLEHDWDYATPRDLPQSVVRDLRGRPYLYAAIKSGGLLVLELTKAAAKPEAVAQLGKRVFAISMS